MIGVPPALLRRPARTLALAAVGFWFLAAQLPAAASSAPQLAASSAVAAPDRSGLALSSAHVTLRCPDAMDPARAGELLRVLEEGRALIVADLELTTDAAVEVLVLTPQGFRALTANPPWVRGAFDGRILLPLGPDEKESPADALRPVLRHELTHFLVRASVPTSLPPWFEEGLAERFEGNAPPAAAAWLSARGAPTFKGLEEIDRSIRAGGWREDAGHQGARLAVQAIEDLAGPDAAARILALVRSGEGFDAALGRIVPGGRLRLEELMGSARWANPP